MRAARLYIRFDPESRASLKPWSIRSPSACNQPAVSPGYSHSPHLGQADTLEGLFFGKGSITLMRLTPLHGPRRINSEVHAGWCSPRTSNPVVPILSGRSVRFRLTSAKALKPAGLSPQWVKRHRNCLIYLITPGFTCYAKGRQRCGLVRAN